MRRIKRKKRKGFLLLEALIAITILSIGLVLIIRSFTNSLYAAKLSKDYMAAISYLEDNLEIIEKERITDMAADNNESSPFNLTTTTTSLISAPPPMESDETAQTNQTDITEEQKKLELDKLQATVSWKTKRKTETLTVFTYLKKKPKNTDYSNEETE